MNRARLSEAWNRVAAVAVKELRELTRDPVMLGFVVGVPLMQLLLFGYAINQDVRHLATALVDHSPSEVSRLLVGRLEATQTFDVVSRPASEAQAREMLLRGDVRVVLVIPPDYSRAYYRGRGAEILVLVDASDPTIARAARAAADGLMEEHNRRLSRFQIDSEAGALRSTERSSFGVEPELIRPRFLRFAVLNLFNPELRTPTFVIPGLLGTILTTTMILMTALAIVRERERGSFEFLIATPVRRNELMLGKLLPYVGIGVLQLALVVAGSLIFFHLPMRGRFIDLTLASLIFIAANLTLGLVISALSKSQFQATQLSFFVFLPSVLLSGFMFPFEAMPVPAQWLGELLPLTQFNRICRGMMLRGATFGDHLPEVGAMLLFTIVGFFAATKLFTKQLD